MKFIARQHAERRVLESRPLQCIYELSPDENGAEFQYRAAERLNLEIDCNLLVVVAQHFLLCVDKKVQLFSFAGVREREWVFDSAVAYIKPVGGTRYRTPTRDIVDTRASICDGPWLQR